MGDARAVVSGIMCLFFAGIVLFALGWSRGAGLAPMVVGIAGLVLSFLQLADDLHTMRREPTKTPRVAIILIGWLAGFVCVTLIFGLLAGAFLSIAAFLRGQERTTYGMAVSVAAIYTAMVWLLLEIVLELTLFPGLLTYL